MSDRYVPEVCELCGYEDKKDPHICVPNCHAAAPTPSTPPPRSDAEALLDALENPPAPNEALKRAMAEYRSDFAAPAQAEQEEFDIGVLEIMRETWANSLGKHPQEWPVKILARLDKAIAHARRLIEQRDEAQRDSARLDWLEHAGVGLSFWPYSWREGIDKQMEKDRASTDREQNQ